MDDLGNRTTVNLRSGANQVYATDTPNITNRYTSVGGQPLAYDAAGNLTQDHDGYRYVYDYENRITRIFKFDGQTEIEVAQYAYDALGRRIGKYDAAAMETIYYYYNDQWQILAEYTDDTTCRQWFTYGNYIDEVLSRNAHPYGLILAMQYYAHDHLYSPAALANASGATIWERYEYDAYGKVTITGRGADNLWYTADDVTLSASAYHNPFTFTGRQLDILDNGNLHHMHYRHRDYSPQLGRFLQQDPIDLLFIGFSSILDPITVDIKNEFIRISPGLFAKYGVLPNTNLKREMLYMAFEGNFLNLRSFLIAYYIASEVIQKEMSLWHEYIGYESNLYQYTISNPVSYQDAYGLSANDVYICYGACYKIFGANPCKALDSCMIGCWQLVALNPNLSFEEYMKIIQDMLREGAGTRLGSELHFCSIFVIFITATLFLLRGYKKLILQIRRGGR